MKLSTFSKLFGALIPAVTAAVAEAVTYGILNTHDQHIATFIISIAVMILTPLGVYVAPANAPASNAGPVMADDLASYGVIPPSIN